MSRLATFLVCATLSLVVSAEEPPKFPTCIDVSASAPYTGAGYDHIVSLSNGCQRAAACRVMTDVSPHSVDVSLAPGDARDVLTYRGSPARTFRARVSCKLEG
jgi:hypothetical protein